MRVGDSLRCIVADWANEQCEYCQYPEQFSPSSFEVEHIVPKSAGGLTEHNNLALACSHCNAHKATRQKGVDPFTGTEVRLFNPRIDDWAAHFLFNREIAEIEGQTRVGRATVIVLNMNAEQPVRARRNLIRLEVL